MSAIGTKESSTEATATATGPAQAAAPSVAKATVASNAWNCFTVCKSAFELLSTQL